MRVPSVCHCTICEKVMPNLSNDSWQPDGGVAFQTSGHYGSTKFDPMDGSFLEIAICDQCLENASYRREVLHIQRTYTEEEIDYFEC